MIKSKHIFFIVVISLFSLTSKVMGQDTHTMKVGMVSIFVEDPVKAFKYYTETLGFVEEMYDPDNYIAIIKSPADINGATILLEPTEPGGLEIAKKYKAELYKKGIPVISFSSADIERTIEDLKLKGVKFKKELTKNDWGLDAIFDDDNGNYIHLYEVKK